MTDTETDVIRTYRVAVATLLRQASTPGGRDLAFVNLPGYAYHDLVVAQMHVDELLMCGEDQPAAAARDDVTPPLTLDDVHDAIARNCGPIVPPALFGGAVTLFLEGVDLGATLVLGLAKQLEGKNQQRKIV